jgi:DNA-binding NtrC family response regulator
MRRRAIIILALLIVAGSASSELAACGDKFLRAGRSARARNYGAVHPATILIYKPGADIKGLDKWQANLKKAGHTPFAVTEQAALSKAVTGKRYDLVIADFADAETIRAHFTDESAQPAFLPIVHNATESQKADATRRFHYVIVPEQMTPHDALDRIDRVLELRTKQTKAAASK